MASLDGSASGNAGKMHVAGNLKIVKKHFFLVFKTVYVIRQIAGFTPYECRWPVLQRPTYISSQTRSSLFIFLFYLRIQVFIESKSFDTV